MLYQQMDDMKTRGTSPFSTFGYHEIPPPQQNFSQIKYLSTSPLKKGKT